jgi:hypothetical protein
MLLTACVSTNAFVVEMFATGSSFAATEWKHFATDDARRLLAFGRLISFFCNGAIAGTNIWLITDAVFSCLERTQISAE